MVIDITKQMKTIYKELKALTRTTIANGIEEALIHDDGEVEVVVTFGTNTEHIVGRRFYRFLSNGSKKHSDKIEDLKKG